jgi:hypothetical protein
MRSGSSNSSIPSKMKRRRPRTVLVLLGIVLVIVVLACIVFSYQSDSFSDVSGIQDRAPLRSDVSSVLQTDNHHGKFSYSAISQHTPNTFASVTSGGSSSASPGIYFITVQTGATHTWCRMLLSAALSGNISVINLAWGAKYAHIKRPQWILEFLNTLKPDDIVMFADGGDTIYTGVPPANILRRFSEMTPATKDIFLTMEGSTHISPVLFNAEANCYHQQTFSGSWGAKKGKCLSAYKRYNPNITSPYRYLNGGGWIARVWAAQIVFRAAVDIIKKDSHWWCDQSVLGGLLLSGKLTGILGLDYRNTFFLPTYHLRPQRDFCASQSSATSPRSDDERPLSLRMCHSGEVPSVLHFNGKSEGKFTSDVMRRTWWYSRYSALQIDAVAAAKETATYLGVQKRRVTIGEVCPAMLFPG